MAAIDTFIDGSNVRCQPFTWTKTADETLTKATVGQRSLLTRHLLRKLLVMAEAVDSYLSQ